MKKSFRLRWMSGVMLVCLFGAAGWVLDSGDKGRTELAAVSEVALRRPTGQPQLVAVEPLPNSEGLMCQWVPASAGTTLMESLQQESQERSSSSQREDSGARIAENLDPAPTRTIRDTYPTYSALALDLNTDEVFLQDENLFGIKVFNRLDNTPPGANFTEPKRQLAGVKTKMQFNCGLYVDPTSGDIYSVSNDTVDTLVIFSRNAQGNVPPKRELRTPHGTYGIAVDEEAQEMYITAQHSHSVVVYRKTAQGEEKPLRTLAGDRTQLEDPHGIALDLKNQWMFVSNHGHVKRRSEEEGGKVSRRTAGGGQIVAGSGRNMPPSITSYPLKANGDTPPIRIIEGPKTQLNWPAHIGVDQEHGEIYVANDSGNSILVFRTTDTGDVAPLRLIKGPKTQLKNPIGIFVDPKNDELWVASMGNHRAIVFPRLANGDAVPKRVIRSAPEDKGALMIGNPGGVAYDSKRGEILVPN